ncbi:MAG: CHRD domain-containing protein [Deinococcales bacterium]
MPKCLDSLAFIKRFTILTLFFISTFSLVKAQVDHSDHPTGNQEARAETSMPSPIELNPSQGLEIGTIFEAYLSPHQEGGEEQDTPPLTPAIFKSTAPSLLRTERLSQGHGVLSFSKDLSRAYVHVKIEGVNPEDIVMFHIHCGRPGQLGPILIDFALAGDLKSYLADGVLALELTNQDIEAVLDHASGVIGAFTLGCPIIPSLPNDKVKTIAGMELIARQGELYFNLHTKGQTFFGDIRGQLHQVQLP